jgi:DNA polymerase-3 subunit delta'
MAGYGTFPLAFAYARYLNCTNPSDKDACGQCLACLKFNELVHPDLHFIFPIASEGTKKTVCDDFLPEWRAFLSSHVYFDLNRWINEMNTTKQALIYAKESDEIMRKVSLRIYEAAYRILFIWMPERMHASCANKLLKVIEEPPQNTMILMVSENPERILGTILSRSQRINVNPIEPEALARYARSHYELSDTEAQDIAHLAHGDYLQMIDVMHRSDENELFLQHVIRIMRNAWSKNVKGMKTFAEDMGPLGRERQRNFLSFCQRLVRENFIYRLQASEMNYMNQEETTFSSKFAPYINERNVFDFMEELSEADRHIAQNGNAKMIFFDLALRTTVLLQK